MLDKFKRRVADIAKDARIFVKYAGGKQKGQLEVIASLLEEANRRLEEMETDTE